LLTPVELPGKESWRVKRNQFIGGIILLVLAAAIFLLVDTTASVPVAITLTVIGIVLVAVSRRE
jgi:predicted membrane metal-binding protein